MARERRELGVPIARIASELGLHSRTLALWLRRKPAKGSSRDLAVPKRRVAPVRRVTVAPESISSLQASRSGLVVSVGAVRVEGLDLAGVVSLVRALAS